LVDTNTDPKLVDFPIPANDDATKSIEAIITHAVDAIKEGLGERKATKDKQAETANKAEAKTEKKTEATEAEAK